MQFLIHLLFIVIISLVLNLNFIECDESQTVYQYYTNGGIKTGLKADGNQFMLNGKQITLLSGSMHYFRVKPLYWRNRLLKMKAIGLNTVDVYTAWNLHELHPNEFNFTGPLDLAKFLKTIKELDMFAIFRPGPYICAEWEFGGLPSWLLRDPNMKVRSSYKPFLNYVENYFKKLIETVKPFEFTTNGGPIIAVQIENEFAAFGNTKSHKTDEQYLEFLREIYIKNGIKELLFTSDNFLQWTQKNGNIPEVLITLNSGNPKDLETLQKLQPNKPLMISEFWTGSYYRKSDKYHARDNSSENSFETSYETSLIHYNSSVNIYMFTGGTNFGFMNGANLIYNTPIRYNPSVTSYVHDSPISESGDYTETYWRAKRVIEKLIKAKNLPKFKQIQEKPNDFVKGNYGSVHMLHQFLTLDDMLKLVKPIVSETLIEMEMIDIKQNYGQNFGFILYKTKCSKFSKLVIEEHVNDRAIVSINHNNIAVIEDINSKNITITTMNEVFTQSSVQELEIIVENLGRLNFGSNDDLNKQRKGLKGSVILDNHRVNNWEIYPLEFEVNFMENLKNIKWRSDLTNMNSSYPMLFRAELNIKDKPKDTFIRMNDMWVKGNIFINNHNLGRFWNIGPQKSFYIPSDLLRVGKNDIFIFDLQNKLENLDKLFVEFIDEQLWS